MEPARRPATAAKEAGSGTAPAAMGAPRGAGKGFGDAHAGLRQGAGNFPIGAVQAYKKDAARRGIGGAKEGGTRAENHAPIRRWGRSKAQRLAMVR